jgi:hypothetical protein
MLHEEVIVRNGVLGTEIGLYWYMSTFTVEYKYSDVGEDGKIVDVTGIGM